jgi:hypothetical protein
MHWIIPRRMCRGECRVGSADVRPPSGRAHAQACRWRRAGHRHPQVTEARVASSCAALLLEWWRPRSHVCQSGDRAPCLTSPDRDLPDRTSRSRAPRAVDARKEGLDLLHLSPGRRHRNCSRARRSSGRVPAAHAPGAAGPDVAVEFRMTGDAEGAIERRTSVLYPLRDPECRSSEFECDSPRGLQCPVARPPRAAPPPGLSDRRGAELCRLTALRTGLEATRCIGPRGKRPRGRRNRSRR